MSKRLNRTFLIDSPSISGVLRPSGAILWNNSVSYGCNEKKLIDKGKQHQIDFVQQALLSSVRCIRLHVNMYFGPVHGPSGRRALLSELFAPPDYRFPGLKDPYYGIHIRMGGNAEEFKGLDPPRYSLESIPKFLKHLNMSLLPSWGVFLALDSISAKRYAKTIIPSIKYFDHKAVHVDRQSYNRSDLNFEWDVIFTLSKSTCLIYGYSGFAYVARDWPGTKVRENCSYIVG